MTKTNQIVTYAPSYITSRLFSQISHKKCKRMKVDLRAMVKMKITGAKRVASVGEDMKRLKVGKCG